MNDAPDSYTMESKLMTLLAVLGIIQALSALFFMGYSIYQSARSFEDLLLNVYGPLLAFDEIVGTILQVSFVWAWNDFVLHFKRQLNNAKITSKEARAVTTGYDCDGDIVVPLAIEDLMQDPSLESSDNYQESADID